MDGHAARAQSVGAGERIHVADHRAQRRPLGQGAVAAAIGGDELGRERQGRGELRRHDRAAADQRDRAARPVEHRHQGQSRITTAEMLFFGEPSISLSE